MLVTNIGVSCTEPVLCTHKDRVQSIIVLLRGLIKTGFEPSTPKVVVEITSEK